MKDQNLLTPTGTQYIRVGVRGADNKTKHYVSVLGRNLDADWQIGQEPTHTSVGSGVTGVEGYNETTGEVVNVNEAYLVIQTTVHSWRLKRNNGVYLLSNNAWFAEVVAWNDTHVNTSL